MVDKDKHIQYIGRCSIVSEVYKDNRTFKLYVLLKLTKPLIIFSTIVVHLLIFD